MVVFIPQGISNDVSEKNEKELQEEITEIFNWLCAKLEVNVEIFFEVIESLFEESKDTHTMLSVDTLKKYRKKSFPKKYIFKEHRLLCRTIKRAVSIYIGIDIEDFTDGKNGTIIPDNERNESCCRLSKEHTEKVKYNWQANKGAFEEKLFECCEAARMFYFPESKLKKIKEDLDAASFTLDYFNRLKNSQASDVEAMTSKEFHWIVHTIQQIPDITEKIKILVNDLNNKHINFTIAEPYLFKKHRQ